MRENWAKFIAFCSFLNFDVGLRLTQLELYFDFNIALTQFGENKGKKINDKKGVIVTKH